jgi:cellobiose transport system permease protein
MTDVLTAPAQPATGGRRRRSGEAGGVNRRPGFLTYGFLLAVILGSAFPLYWSFLIGSYDATVVNEDLPPIWPGGHFF